MTKEFAINELVKNWGMENADVIEFCMIFESYPLLADNAEYITTMFRHYNEMAMAHMAIAGCAVEA